MVNTYMLTCIFPQHSNIVMFIHVTLVPFMVWKQIKDIANFLNIYNNCT